MTLIQTIYNRDRIIQVADRRLTWADESVADDEFTKMVCWNTSFSVAFTGISRIDRRGRKPTSEWAAEVLCDYMIFENGLYALREDAESRVKRLPWADKRLAVVVAGFDERNTPLVAVVANFDVQTGAAINQDEFHIRSGLIQPGQFTAALTAGAIPQAFEQRLLRKYIPKVLRKDRVNGHNRAIKLLVENQRRVHKYNGTVGEDAQAVTIPRKRAPHGIVMSNMDGTDLPIDAPSFAYLDKHGFDYKQLGPLMATGGQVIDQVVGIADPECPDNGSMSIRILKQPSPPRAYRAEPR